jgi:hypothetical protein
MYGSETLVLSKMFEGNGPSGVIMFPLMTSWTLIFLVDSFSFTECVS